MNFDLFCIFNRKKIYENYQTILKKGNLIKTKIVKGKCIDLNYHMEIKITQNLTVEENVSISDTI
jgi:hypothetical protein